MGWIQDRWHELTQAGPVTWLAWAAWAALALTVVVLIYAHRQIRRGRRLAAEQTRPHVAMFMEPHAADWHLIELVVHNFGKTAAHNIRFAFPHPPTVAEYEDAHDGYANVVELQLPSELTTLAPGQEGRMVWDSALDRVELGEAIESRFTGTVTYYDRPGDPPRWKFWQPRRRPLETKVVLDWDSLPPVHRIELMTTHDLARREKQKLELLRGLLVSRRCQPQLHDLQSRVRDRHSDRDLVGLDVVGRGGHPVVTAGQQERAHRNRVTGAGHHHRLGVGQQPVGELETAFEHLDRGLHLAGGQDFQVEPAAEHPRVPGDHHRPDAVAVSAVERLLQRLLHGRAQRIDLAVVHGDDRDGIVVAIGDRAAHGS